MRNEQQLRPPRRRVLYALAGVSAGLSSPFSTETDTIRVPFLPNVGRPDFSFFCTRFHHARSPAFIGFERAWRCSGVSASGSANTFARRSYSSSAPFSGRFISCCTASKSSRNIFSGHLSANDGQAKPIDQDDPSRRRRQAARNHPANKSGAAGFCSECSIAAV